MHCISQYKVTFSFTSQVTVSESEEDSQVGEVDEMDNRYSATDVDADDSDFDGESPPPPIQYEA